MNKTINELLIDIKLCLNNNVCNVQSLDVARDRGRTSKELLTMLTKKYKWIKRQNKSKLQKIKLPYYLKSQNLSLKK